MPGEKSKPKAIIASHKELTAKTDKENKDVRLHSFINEVNNYVSE